ncbi:(2Fe-2S)-binding protein [Plastoroseomonas arctica]|uniref:(2Fe-2S)-binding protein n=1 Tax=Plastoroseomonas arctica TaxID=1509237 RepID=UPI00346380B5
MSEAVYICLCNGLTDRVVGQAVEGGAARPGEVYAACQCKAQCGSCVRLILGIIKDLASGQPAVQR